MGKETKKRTKKLGEALDEYTRALDVYNGELEQVKHDKEEIKKDVLAGKDVAMAKQLLLQRLTVVLPKDRENKDLKLKGLQTAYQDLVTYFDKKTPKEKENYKYKAMKVLISKVKQTGVVEV